MMIQRAGSSINAQPWQRDIAGICGRPSQAAGGGTDPVSEICTPSPAQNQGGFNTFLELSRLQIV